MVLAVVHMGATPPSNWRVDFIHRYRIPTRLLDAEYLQRDQKLHGLPFGRYVADVCKKAVSRRRPLAERIDEEVGDVRVAGKCVVIPDPSGSRSWCVVFGEVSSITAIGRDTRYDDVDLSIKGAFSDLGVMQRRLAELDAKVASLAIQKAALQKLEDSKSQNRIERINLKSRFATDMSERKNAVRAAILAVDEALNALYTDGRQKFLRIESTETGPKFIIWIAGDRSGGIANMEIFCMDFGLYKVVSSRMTGPRFLIHDSHLFDGVDPRQTSTAIELASKLADSIDGQYIVTMNSDKFEKLVFSDEVRVLEKVVPVRLEDSPTGGLFGFRFE